MAPPRCESCGKELDCLSVTEYVRVKYEWDEEEGCFIRGEEDAEIDVCCPYCGEPLPETLLEDC